MKKLVLIIALAAIAVASSSCSDKMCRCVYGDGEVDYIHADEGDDCNISYVAGGERVSCSEE